MLKFHSETRRSPSDLLLLDPGMARKISSRRAYEGLLSSMDTHGLSPLESST